MNVPRIVITESYGPQIRQLVRSTVPVDWTVDYLHEADAQALQRATVLCSGAAGASAAMLARLPSLRLVQHLGVGVEKIDQAACKAHRVGVLRLAAANAVPVAEHTVLLILAALRRLPFQDRRVRAGEWDRESIRGFARMLHHKRVGLIGFGAIGRAVARRLHGFEVDLLYCAPRPASHDDETRFNVRRAGLDEIVSTCDVVSLHCPLNDETRNLIDASRIASMKPTAVLVNCARGALVDQAALEQALYEGRLLGAGLDTLTTEPPGDLSLLACDSAVFTPHAAASTFDNFELVLRRAVDNIRGYLVGEAVAESDLVLEMRPLQ